jgi:hypothetical protein
VCGSSPLEAADLPSEPCHEEGRKGRLPLRETGYRIAGIVNLTNRMIVVVTTKLSQASSNIRSQNGKW